MFAARALPVSATRDRSFDLECWPRSQRPLFKRPAMGASILAPSGLRPSPAPGVERIGLIIPTPAASRPPPAPGRAVDPDASGLTTFASARSRADRPHITSIPTRPSPASGVERSGLMASILAPSGLRPSRTVARRSKGVICNGPGKCLFSASLSPPRDTRLAAPPAFGPEGKTSYHRARQ